MSEPCPLWVLLVQKFALGTISAIELQHLADAAVKSGASTPEMLQLQGLGAMGQQSGNVHRDLLRKCFTHLQAPAPYKLTCQMAMKVDCEKNPQMTQQLWRSLDFDRPESLPIPWCLHGDGAPFTETDSIEVISFRCLLTSMPVGDSQLLLAAIPKAAVSKETFNTIMECMAWSFTSLYEGKAPKKNHSGVPMDGVKGRPLRRGVLWAITGDLEWFASQFGFPYSSSNMICAYCLADQKKTGSERPFTDCRPTAAWRSSILSPKFLQKEYGAHPLFKVPACSALAIKLDILHVLDLGVAAYLHGSVLIDIMDKLGGTSRSLATFFALGEAKMQLLNKKIAEMYGKLGIEAAKRIKYLTLNDVASSAEEYPVLKHIKGNKIRHFAPVALELSKLHADDRAGQHRVAMLEELQRIYTLLGKNWKEWSPECGIALERAGQVLLAHYSWLANDAFEKGLHRYSLVQKHHKLNHLLAQAHHIHPASAWCYGSESFMGIIKQISSSCTWGTPAHKVTGKVLMKFRLVFHLLLKGYRNLDIIDSAEE
ncbi:Uncharacterized protein SCF082_LOCUS39746 [Durusdinium trenchii]|uniref:Uncharacterized protein n=1 Tax=Durusdinium trenchii TaxID=1381693 RepID=A0ABP0Q7V8_9DINO